MKCPFLINENKEIINNINSVGDINQTIVKHDRRYSPCMGEHCFYYSEYKDRHNNHIVECTRIDRRRNLGKN